MTIYFSDEVLELIEMLPGKGTLINSLVKEHFANDEETLRRKVEYMDRQLENLKAKLNGLVEGRLQEQEKRLEVKQESNEKAEKVRVNNKIQDLWSSGKMEDDEYWSCFGKDGLIFDKAQEILKKVLNLTT